MARVVRTPDMKIVFIERPEELEHMEYDANAIYIREYCIREQIQREIKRTTWPKGLRHLPKVRQRSARDQQADGS